MFRCGGASNDTPRDEPRREFQFPMWVISIRCFLEMAAGPMKCHQQLLSEGKLLQWTPGMFCLFVSHQWLGQQHCDPDGKQMETLRGLLRSLIDGSIKVYSGLIQFIAYQRVSKISVDECKKIENGFLWLDWASIPQLSMRSAGEWPNMEEHVQQGISSIPAYADASDMMFVLCPPLQHSQTEEVCSLETWAKRGWCRLELAAASFTQHQKPLVVANSPTNSYLVSTSEPFFDAPGLGVFSQEADRVKLLPVMEAIISDHLEFLWKRPETVVRARLLTGVHGRLLRGIGPEGQRDLHVRQASTSDLEEFLRGFRFDSATGPATAGFGPVHCAALALNVPILRQLAAAKADMNQRITKDYPDEQLLKGVTPLLMASSGSPSNSFDPSDTQVVECLLELRADLLSRTALGFDVLHYATFSGRTQLMDFYLNQGLSIEHRSITGDTALHIASLKTRPHALRFLLQRRANVHATTVFGATPLMMAVLVGSAECCRVLVEEGADAKKECQPVGLKGEVISRLLGLCSLWLPKTGAVGALARLRGQTPLSVASSLGFSDIVEVLEKGPQEEGLSI